MDTPIKNTSTASRRGFLKSACLTLAGIGSATALSYTTENAHAQNTAKEQQNTTWPWPVAYGKEHHIKVDVLVIGGGLAGSHAAINAHRKGVSVAVIDKGPIAHSGSGGTGIDHWLGCLLNPCSKMTVPMLETAANNGQGREYGLAHTRYIMMREGWDTLKDLEDWGLQIRDIHDEFKGTCYRDEETKLLFAYNTDDKFSIRIPGGAKMKHVLHEEMQRRKISLYDFTMGTSLLTENGKQGAQVVGATALNIRTGEFYVFEAKAVILTSSRPQKLWVFSDEQNGSASSFYDPNNTGDGYDMAFRAGAEFVNMEFSHKKMASGGFSYPSYGVGNAHNTWYPCTIVDANGKEVPWVNSEGKKLTTVEERYKKSKKRAGDLHPASLIRDLPERIQKGEFTLPLYADLPSMPSKDRRAIWGLHVGNEGKTRYAIYDLYQKQGFDPNKDMLQVPVMHPDMYSFEPWWMGQGAPHYRESSFWSGSLLVDWNLRTSLKGLYAAGGIGGQAAASGSSITGRYAGRQAATFAKNNTHKLLLRAQIDHEKERVYAPVTRQSNMGWKEVKAGLCRIMQDYCGEYRSDSTLKQGLQWFKSVRENEMQELCARNPRELARALECMTHITVGEMMMHASFVRKASSFPLGLRKLDYPQKDPKEWHKFISIRQEEGQLKTRDLPLKFWCKPPFSKTFNENYKKNCAL